MVTYYLIAQGLTMDGVIVQQSFKRNSGRRNGFGKDDSDNQSHHIPHREEGATRPLSNHRAFIVSCGNVLASETRLLM